MPVLEAVSAVVNTQRFSLEARGHQLKVEVPPGLPDIWADPIRLGQVLDNLVSNAIKYTPKRGQIVIKAAVLDQATLSEERRAQLKASRHYLSISVTDSGLGIAPEDHEKVFERFFRVESELKVEAGGTGLGLSIVRPLARLMGGQIWLDSEPGEGSTFTVVIPTA